MRCSEAERAIRALGGGEKPSPDLLRHLEACANCSAVLADHQRTLVAIKALLWPEPGPKLIERLRQPELLRPAAGPEHAARRIPGRAIDPPPPGPTRAILELPRRRWRWGEAFAVGLVLLVVGGLLIQQRRVVPATTPPSAATTASTAAPGASATPAAVATRIGEGQALAEFRGAAARPLDLVLRARWGRADDLRCRRVWAELGDGTVRELECHLLPADAYPDFPSAATYTIGHAYASGTYFPQLKMTLDDGSELVQTAAQVIITPAPPRSLGAEILRLEALPWTVAIVAFGLLWLVSRKTRDRWLGLVLALAVGIVFIVELVIPLSPRLNAALDGLRGRSHLHPPMLAYLDALRGQVGLDPLDPASPLADYAVEGISKNEGWINYVTRFTYADGRTRRYQVPIERRGSPTRKDGLGRLRTEHRELPGIPFADFKRDGIALETPVRLPARSEADEPRSASRLAAAALPWLESGCALDRGNLVPAPDGSAFLVARWMDGNTPLWWVPLDSGPDRLIDESVYDYQWSPDSRHLVLVKQVGGVGTALLRYNVATGAESVVATVRGPAASAGMSSSGVLYAQADGLWQAPWTGAGAQRLLAWPADEAFAPAHPRWLESRGPDRSPEIAESALVRADPAGKRIAYTCRGGLCLADLDGNESSVVDLRVDNLAWSPDGLLLAAVEAVPRAAWALITPKAPRKLWLIGRDGSVQSTTTIAPGGWVSPPAWTTDSRRLFLTTCPLDGRRIITVESGTGEVRDLSQPRWDAWAALMPGENALLLSNGRGGYWRAGIQERARAP